MKLPFLLSEGKAQEHFLLIFQQLDRNATCSVREHECCNSDSFKFLPACFEHINQNNVSVLKELVEENDTPFKWPSHKETHGSLKGLDSPGMQSRKEPFHWASTGLEKGVLGKPLHLQCSGILNGLGWIIKGGNNNAHIDTQEQAVF